LLGATLIALSLLLGGTAAYRWTASSFATPTSVMPIVIAGVLGTLGVQMMFGGMVLAMVRGPGGETKVRPRAGDVLAAEWDAA
jgi:hypothetical protein